MKRVIDSSVAVKWVLPENLTDKALLVRDDYRNQLVELIAPDVYIVEIAHALTRAERQGRIVVSDAVKHLTDLLSTLPALHPTLSLLLRATQISSQLRIGVYDCLYVALAEREQCEFITADDKLIKNVQAHFPFVVPLSSLP